MFDLPGTVVNETNIVNSVINKAIAAMAAAGATIVNIASPMLASPYISATYDVQKYEFPDALTQYLNRSSLNAPYRSFDQIVASKKFLPVCYTEILGQAMATSNNDPSYRTRLSKYSDQQYRLYKEFSMHNLDAVVYPEQKNLVVTIGSPSQKGRNGILAATTGSPVVVVPAGFSPISATAPIGIPIGMEILGLPFSEAKLLGKISVSFIICMLTLLSMPLTDIHFCVGLAFMTPSL
jgi:Asp-tRNA(Asn)/Glu-tRNA(Gln) amidotransferase A subunit family amidase